MAYVVVPRMWRFNVLRRIRAENCEATVFLHLPNAKKPSVITPISAPALNFVFGKASAFPPWTRRVIQYLVRGRVVLNALAFLMRDVGIVVTAKDARPGEWLGSFTEDEIQDVVLQPGWRGGDSSVLLYAFTGNENRPEIVVKVPRGPASDDACRRERQNLLQIASAAADAGARVPRLLGTRPINGYTALVETAIAGIPAAVSVATERYRVEELLSTIAEWLLAWNRVTRRVRTLEENDFEKRIRRPLQILPDAVSAVLENQFGERLRAEIGRELVVAAGHGDLTLHNILVKDDLPLGVVDWEAAEPESFALEDFFYVAVDLAMTVDRTSRLSAFQACFTPGGRHADVVKQLCQHMMGELDLDPAHAELAFHACWIGHAANEVRRNGARNDRPFLNIVRWYADHSFYLYTMSRAN